MQTQQKHLAKMIGYLCCLTISIAQNSSEISIYIENKCQPISQYIIVDDNFGDNRRIVSPLIDNCLHVILCVYIKDIFESIPDSHRNQ